MTEKGRIGVEALAVLSSAGFAAYFSRRALSYLRTAYRPESKGMIFPQ